jgi:hypothetical protein
VYKIIDFQHEFVERERNLTENCGKYGRFIKVIIPVTACRNLVVASRSASGMSGV